MHAEGAERAPEQHLELDPESLSKKVQSQTQIAQQILSRVYPPLLNPMYTIVARKWVGANLETLENHLSADEHFHLVKTPRVASSVTPYSALTRNFQGASSSGIFIFCGVIISNPVER